MRGRKPEVRAILEGMTIVAASASCELREYNFERIRGINWKRALGQCTRKERRVG